MKFESLFYGRLDELCSKAACGIPSCTVFLSPEDLAAAEKYLGGADGISKIRLGGYPDAERCMLLLCPDYIPIDALAIDEFIAAVEIKTSGYVSLRHSSFLGALTSLGIDRDSIGDILLHEGSGTVFVTPPIAGFLLSTENPLERVGRDAVKVCAADISKYSDHRRSYTEGSITVASARIDAIAAELAHTSREKAKELIARGDVSLNHMSELDPSDTVKEGDIVSVRRVGKFKLCEQTETKKGRVRISLLIYT